MMSALLIPLLLLVGVSGLAYLPLCRLQRRHAIFGACLLATFALALAGVPLRAPAAAYYVPAFALPALSFFVLFGQRPWPLAAFYALDLAALLVLIYGFTLGTQFYNFDMQPPPLQDYPSAVILDAWATAFLDFVLPLNVMVLAGYPVVIMIARWMPNSKSLAVPWNWRALAVSGMAVAAGVLLHLAAA